MKKMKMFKEYIDSQLFKNILNAGGEVYFVGGCVRDTFLERSSKDIDIIVRLLTSDKLKEIFSKTGTSDLVGNSFGVWKYKDDLGFELDVALPRRDSKIEGEKGHKAIDAQSDPFMSLEEDLKRRDFTFNAMAFDINLNLIDLFDGLKDLKSKLVRCVDPKAFADDPLRILRAIRFTAQLGFSLEHQTLELIKTHKIGLFSIPAERKLEELKKIVASGISTNEFSKILNSTDTTKEIFGIEFFNFESSINLKTIAELLVLIPKRYLAHEKKVDHFIKELTIDVDTQNLLKAFIFYTVNELSGEKFKVDLRWTMFMTFQIAKNDSILDSDLIRPTLKIDFSKTGKNFPTHKHQLKISGEELMSFGIMGKEINEMHKIILEEIFNENISNNGWDIAKFLYNKMKL